MKHEVFIALTITATLMPAVSNAAEGCAFWPGENYSGEYVAYQPNHGAFLMPQGTEPRKLRSVQTIRRMKKLLHTPELAGKVASWRSGPGCDAGIVLPIENGEYDDTNGGDVPSLGDDIGKAVAVYCVCPGQ